MMDTAYFEKQLTGTAFKEMVLDELIREHRFDPQDFARIRASYHTGRELPRKPPNPVQQPTNYIEGLPSSPWYPSGIFDWVPLLEEKADAIRKEYEKVRTLGEAHPEKDKLTDAGNWNKVSFYQSGIKQEENCLACPVTTALIETIPGATIAGSVFFSIASPGTHIVPHFGPHNARIRCHLGLKTPKNCGMRVGSETRSWQYGKCLFFDDSYEHEVWNHSDEDRVILILDVWNPGVTGFEQLAIRNLDFQRMNIVAHASQHGSIPAPYDAIIQLNGD